MFSVMNARPGSLVILVPLLTGGCIGTGHASAPASGGSTPEVARQAPNKVAAVAIPAVKGRYPGDPPPPGASRPVRLYAAPASVARLCRGAQQGFPLIVLCPTLLPKATLPNMPGKPVGSLETVRDPGGYEVNYGDAWEPLSGVGWKRHLWRNRPCCFFHFTLVVYGRRAPSSYFPDQRNPPERPIMCGGYRAHLYKGRIAGHIVVLFTRRGVHYDATEHSFGDGTLTLLCRIIRGLRPVQRAP